MRQSQDPNRTVPRRLSMRAHARAGIASLALLPLAAMAQEADGGLTAQLNVSQQIRIDDNLSLSTTNSETVTSAVTNLAFNLDSQTRTQNLSLYAATGYRFIQDGDSDLIDPTFALSYRREGASASFDIAARYEQTDIGFIRTLEDFVTTGLPLPEDFDDLTGTGTRRALGLDATLALRTDAPFGITFRAGISDLSYEDVTSSDLLDSTRTTLDATARFTISPVLETTLGVTGTRFEQDTFSTRETFQIRAGASLDRPDGGYGATFTATDTEEGRQYALTLSRDITLRNAALSAGIGASRAANGESYLSGSLDYRLEGEAGSLTVGIDRSLRSDSSDAEELLTSLSLATDYVLTPQSALGADLTLARAENTATGDGTDVASLGISYSRTLTRDWSLSASYSFEHRDPDDGASAQASSIGVSISRSFDVRF